MTAPTPGADRNGSFWTTLPGILSGLAALVAAVGGVLGIVLSQQSPSEPRVLPGVVERSETETTAERSPATDSPTADVPISEQPRPDTRTLDEITSFVRERSVPIPDDPAGVGSSYVSFVPVTDVTGTIAVDVPAEWFDVDGDFLVGTAPAIAASPDLAALGSGWDEPGVVITATADPALFEAVFGSILHEAESQCSGLGQEVYDDGLYLGTIAAWSRCAGTDTSVIAVTAQPLDGSFWVLVAVQLVGDRDIDAAATILDSFIVL